MRPESADELSFSNPFYLAKWLHERGLVSVYIQRIGSRGRGGGSSDWMIKSYPDGLLRPWDESVYPIPSFDRRWEVLHQAARTAARKFDIGKWETFIKPGWVFPSTSVAFAKSQGIGSNIQRYYRAIDTEKYRKG